MPRSGEYSYISSGRVNISDGGDGGGSFLYHGNVDKQKKQRERFKKKIKKCEELLKHLRGLVDKLNSFMYNVTEKPSDVLKIDKEIKRVVKKMPRFTSTEVYCFLSQEYCLVKKYFICLNCKTDLNSLVQDKENTKQMIICSDCGITYRIEGAETLFESATVPDLAF